MLKSEECLARSKGHVGGKNSYLGAYPDAPRVFIKQEDSFHEVARVSGMGTLRRNVTRAAHHVPKTGIIRTPLHFRVKAYVSCMGQSEIDERTSDEV